MGYTSEDRCVRERIFASHIFLNSLSQAFGAFAGSLCDFLSQTVLAIKSFLRLIFITS